MRCSIFWSNLKWLPVALLGASVAQAQGPAIVRGEPVTRDSAVVRLVGTALVQQLAHQIARASLDTTSSALAMEFPDEEAPAAWAALRTHLQVILRGRDRVGADRSEVSLRVRPAVVDGDSIVVFVSIGYLSACRDGWTGMVQTYAVRSARNRADAPWLVPTTSWYGESLGDCSILGGRLPREDTTTHGSFDA